MMQFLFSAIIFYNFPQFHPILATNILF
jgi:hypothetical protein